MKVRALVHHFNDYGKSREKDKGTEYEIPEDRDAEILIADGTVEAIGDKK